MRNGAGTPLPTRCPSLLTRAAGQGRGGKRRRSQSLTKSREEKRSAPRENRGSARGPAAALPRHVRGPPGEPPRPAPLLTSAGPALPPRDPARGRGPPARRNFSRRPREAERAGSDRPARGPPRPPLTRGGSASRSRRRRPRPPAAAPGGAGGAACCSIALRPLLCRRRPSPDRSRSARPAHGATFRAPALRKPHCPRPRPRGWAPLGPRPPPARRRRGRTSCPAPGRSPSPARPAEATGGEGKRATCPGHDVRDSELRLHKEPRPKVVVLP